LTQAFKFKYAKQAIDDMDRYVNSLNLNDDDDVRSPVDELVFDKADACSSVSADLAKNKRPSKFDQRHAHCANHRR